ncbi:MAG: nucleotidyltransferase family protein [Chitinophagales bacterium]
MDYSHHLIDHSETIRTALERINQLPILSLFAVNEGKLVGSITDGDIRRALVKGVTVDQSVAAVMNRNFSFLRKGKYSIDEILAFKKRKLKLVPFLDESDAILRLIDLEGNRSLLPIDAVIMAGGEGRRLRPMTNNIPKPLLRIANKPIIDYNIDRLENYGVGNCYITVKYLGESIIDHVESRAGREMSIKFIEESDLPLGTIGSVSLIEQFEHDHVLVMNSDLLTNIDFEDFFIEFEKQNAAMSVATVPYHVTVPYAVLETEADKILGFKEKPTYTYYSNAGIYLIRRDILGRIPKGIPYNATDLMEDLIQSGHHVSTYPLYGYWLDIGKPEDFAKAQEDVKHIKF